MDELTLTQNSIKQAQLDVEKWQRHLQSSGMYFYKYDPVACINMIECLNNEIERLTLHRDKLAGQVV